MDADSYVDILVGAYGEDLAYLIHGSVWAPPRRSWPMPMWSLKASRAGRTGYELRNAGDLDGDGQDDIIMSAHLFTHSGGTGEAMVMLADGLIMTNYNTADADYAWLAKTTTTMRACRWTARATWMGMVPMTCSSAPRAATLQEPMRARPTSCSIPAGGTVNLSTADYIFLGADAERTQVRQAGDVDADGRPTSRSGRQRPGAGAAGPCDSRRRPRGGTIDLSTVEHCFAGEVGNDEAEVLSGRRGMWTEAALLLVGAHARSNVANRAGKVYLLLSDL